MRNIRRLLIGLIILVVIAGNIQLAKAQSSEPELTPVFKVPVNDEEIKPESPGAFFGGAGGLVIFDNAVYFLASYDNVIGKMDLSTRKVSKFYESETSVGIAQFYRLHGNLWLLSLNYAQVPGPQEGTHITVPPGAGAMVIVNMTTKETVWSFPTKYPPGIYGVQGDIVYFAVNDEGIYALNLSTRKVRWLYPYPENSGFNEVKLIQDTIYVIIPDSTLVALDTSTGKEKFRFDMGKESVSNLRVVNETLYGEIWKYNKGANNFNVSFFAFNLSSMRFLWETMLYSFVNSDQLDPIITSHSIYVTGIKGERNGILTSRIYALNASTGKVMWSSSEGYFNSKIFLIGSCLYVIEFISENFQRSSHNYFVINVYNTNNGEKVWSYRLGSDAYPEAPEDYWMYGTAVYDAILYDNTLILSGFEGIYEEARTYAPVTFCIWGFKSQSAESVPEFSHTPLIFSASILTLIPLLLRKKGREINQ